MVTETDIQALLADGPELAVRLAEWLDIDVIRLRVVLDKMRVPTCERCCRRFLPRHSGAGRYCSHACYLNDVASQELPRASPGRRNENDNFDVVWSGVGPLPGAGSASGLGSTLSGIHFSVPRAISLSAVRR
jgi:hypothetical protein